MASTKLLTTCNFCRLKKVRCLKRHSTDETCIRCDVRGERCHFSEVKQRRVKGIKPAQNAITSVLPLSGPLNPADSRPEAPADEVDLPSAAVRSHVSQLSESGSTVYQHSLASQDNQRLLLQQKQKNVSTESMEFFTEGKITLLEEKLGSKRVSEILSSVKAFSAARRDLHLENLITNPVCPIDEFLQQFPSKKLALYIHVYFEDIHPVWPHLTHETFDLAANAPDLGHRLESGHTWAATFYAVVSLGILHKEPGSFAPLQGPAWSVFQRAIKLFPLLLMGQESLNIAQALATMALFAINFSSWPFEKLLVTEAARVCVALRMNKASLSMEDARTQSTVFWTVYCLEKEYCFHSSVSTLIDDANISCPLPELPSEPPYLANLNLLTAFCQIQSRAYSRLFAVTAHKNPQEQIYTEIDSLHNDLEAWRQSVPEEYRPGLPLRMRQLPKSSFILMALQHHLSYYLLLVAIARLDIYLSCGSGSVRSTKSKKVLMEAARSIVEVVQLAPLEPSTPMNIIALAPVVATFILFELVVFNPHHSETPRNQAFLDIITGYWLRLEMVSDGQLAGHLLSEFASIAKDSLSRVQVFNGMGLQQLRPETTISTQLIILGEDLTSNGESGPSIEAGDQPGWDTASYQMNENDEFPLYFPLTDDWFDSGIFESELGFVDVFGKAIR